MLGIAFLVMAAVRVVAPVWPGLALLAVGLGGLGWVAARHRELR